MKERPILFSATMVRALLNGSKTQTRRIVKPQFDQDAEPEEMSATTPEGWQTTGPSGCWWDAVQGNVDRAIHCPYGQLGNRLWVRETHRPIFGQTCGLIAIDYKADPREKWQRLGDEIGTPTKWLPSIHMRRKYSRINLEITLVRVERLQDISEAEAIAEGIRQIDEFHDGDALRPIYWFEPTDQRNCAMMNPVTAYRALWESINGTESWALNPWVWVIEFRRAIS